MLARFDRSRASARRSAASSNGVLAALIMRWPVVEGVNCPTGGAGNGGGGGDGGVRAEVDDEGEGEGEPSSGRDGGTTPRAAWAGGGGVPRTR